MLSKTSLRLKMSFRILFCGTPEFAIPSLQALSADSDFEVVQVISQPDRPAGRGYKLQPSPIKLEAQTLHLPVSTPENINATEVIDSLKSLKLDAIVVVAYGQILKQAFLDLCPQKNVNLHGSLLPRWRGAAPLQRSLMVGDKNSGVSLQVIVRKLDAGPVIGEKKVPVPLEMNTLELHNLLAREGAALFTREFKAYLRGEIQPQHQDESLVTYAEKISKEETRIVWTETSVVIHNRVRGLYMGPQAWSTSHGKSYKIHATRLQSSSGKPGELLQVGSGVLRVACGQGSVDVLEIQPESKKKMLVEEFLKGTTLKVGDQFV